MFFEMAIKDTKRTKKPEIFNFSLSLNQNNVLAFLTPLLLFNKCDRKRSLATYKDDLRKESNALSRFSLPLIKGGSEKRNDSTFRYVSLFIEINS